MEFVLRLDDGEIAFVHRPCGEVLYLAKGFGLWDLNTFAAGHHCPE